MMEFLQIAIGEIKRKMKKNKIASYGSRFDEEMSKNLQILHVNVTSLKSHSQISKKIEQHTLAHQDIKLAWPHFSVSLMKQKIYQHVLHLNLLVVMYMVSVPLSLKVEVIHQMS